MTSHMPTSDSDTQAMQAPPATQEAVGDLRPLVVCQAESVRRFLDVSPQSLELKTLQDLTANPRQASRRQVIAVGLLEHDCPAFMRQVEEICSKSSAQSMAGLFPNRRYKNETLFEWCTKDLNDEDRASHGLALLQGWTDVRPCWPHLKLSHFTCLPASTGFHLTLPPRQFLLEPILPHPHLSMVYAKRGVGKTHFALGMAVAVASGGTFLKYKAPKPRQMLYIDGEMPRYDILRRLKAAPAAQELSSAYFQILSASDNDLQLPDLGTDGGRRAFTELIAPFDFIVLDNLSSLAPTLKENEGDSWAPIQHWLLNARSKGKSLMLVHHGGKSGGQRGTSRKEDVLDTIIELVEPPGKTASAGAVFDVHLTKSRSCLGKPAGSFSARLSPDTGEWTVTDIGQKEAEDHARIRQLREEGKTIREINELTGVPKSTVDRMLKAGEET